LEHDLKRLNDRIKKAEGAKREYRDNIRRAQAILGEPVKNVGEEIRVKQEEKVGAPLRVELMIEIPCREA
jgi:hypothetical protein